MELYDVSPLTAEVSLNDYTASCIDVEKFLGFCRECPNYGRKWACPPLAFDPMEIWGAYRSLTLYARVLTPRQGVTQRELMDIFLREKQRLTEEVLQLEHSIPGSLSLAASTCTACSACTRPEGLPCRHPEQLRYSIEALGGDVGLTMEKYLHKPLMWAENGKLPPYLVCVAGLLTG